MPQVEQDYNLMQPTQTPTPATPEAQTAQQTDWRALFNQLVPQSTQPQGIVSPENAAALGPQSVPWLGLSSAMKGFEQGFNENRAQQAAKEQAQIAGETKKREEVGKINKEWETRNKDVKSTVEQFNRGVAAFNANFGKTADKANPAADQSLIFAYLKSRAPSMRLTDAGVDEAANQGIIDAYTVSLWNKFKGGTALLEDTERQKYMNATKLGLDALSTQFKQDRKQFARDYGVTENDLQDFTAAVDEPVESDAKVNEYIKRAKQVLADPKSLPADKERANRILNIK